MELNAIRPTGPQPSPAIVPAPPAQAAGAPAADASPNELKPEDVPLIMSQSALAQGQSLAELPLVESAQEAQVEQAVAEMVSPEGAYTPRAILPDEVKKVLDAYNGEVRKALEQATSGSRLDRFETSLRMLANLQDPRLQQDKQAWDVIQMRRSQIESEYQRLIQTPEVKQAFDQAREQALVKIFGSELKQRAGQQAAYLLSEDFQQELAKLPENEVQGRVQQELSALAILDPKQADVIASELIKRTVAHQALKSLQSQDESGIQVREGLSSALGVYLKAQQTAVGVSVQATNLSRLANLPDDQIKHLTDAVAELAQDTKADTHQQLANSLLSRVDDLPVELRQNASALIKHMQTQKVLGTVLLAGSVAGLMRTELPQDPKAWVSLGTGVVGTATMSHHAFRLVGLNQTADFAAKLNASAALGSLKIPVVGSLLTGINTTMDAVALVNEYQNEDHVGMATRAMGVGSGLATLAAITVMSGPAAPITLIGSTVVGLAAWGIDSVWGESDLTGKIRQDLRKLGISEQEERILEQYEQGKPVAEASNPERVALVNALMDQRTNSREETMIYDTLMQVPAANFGALLKNIHAGRVVAELERRDELRGFLTRVAETVQPGPDTPKLLGPLMQSLATEKRSHELRDFLAKASPELKQTLPPATLQTMIDQLLKGWTGGSEEKAVISLLTDSGLKQPREGMLKLGGEKLVVKLNKELPESVTTTLIGSMLASEDPEVRSLAGKLYQLPGQRRGHLTHLGSDSTAARITADALKQLSADQLQSLPPDLKARMTQLLSLGSKHQDLVNRLKG